MNINKIKNRQLARQSSSAVFMSIKDNDNKKVTFNTQDGLEDNIDKQMVMRNKLATRDNGMKRQFRPQIYWHKRRGQSRNFYDTHNYDRGNYQNRYRSTSKDRRIQFSGQSRGRLRYEQTYRKGNYRGNYRNENYSRETSRSRSRERSFSRNVNNRGNDRSISNSRSRSGSGVSTNRDRIRCYNWREYDHFVKYYPMSKKEREIEQIFNLDEGQTSLKTLATDTYDSLNKINALENITLVQDHLSLWKVRMTSPYFCL